MKKANLLKALSLILALLMMFSLVACGGGDETAKDQTSGKTETSDKKDDTAKNEGGEPAVAKKTKVTVGITDNVSTCTPLYKVNSYTNAVLSGIFEHLGQSVSADDDTFVGVLMKNWETTDGVVYNIELYDNIYDSQGNHFTASDVKYSLEKEKEAGVAQSKYAKEVEVTGDYTLKLTLSNGAVGYFEELCQNTWMFTQAAMEASADEMASTPVGTGPYVLTDFAPSSHVTMEKREDYWQSADKAPVCSAANVDVIHYDILSEATQMSLALSNGTIQMGFFLPNVIVPEAQATSTVITESYPTPQFKCFVFNCSENSIFGGENGKLLRQAVLYAIDENALVASALNGIGETPKTWGIAGTTGYNDAWEDEDYYSYNPEKAKELLAEAGYPNGFSCQFWSVDHALGRSYMQVVQACCAAVGIDIELNFLASNINSQYQNDPASGWDMYTISYTSGSPYMASYYDYFCNADLRKHGGSIFGLKDEKLQELTLAATAQDWTQADVDALHDYVVDNAFIYTYFDIVNTASRVPEIEELYLNWRGDVQPGACTYGADYAVYAD